MELLQLQYFLKVARLEHMTEAARTLHVTQSSLSKTIQRLEEDVGVPLFDRTGRKLRLNEFGSKFLPRVERALFELEQGKQELRDLFNLEHEVLELVVTTASTLPHILRELRSKHPHIQFHVQMLTTEEAAVLLNRGEVDFCLSSPPIHRDDIDYEIVHVAPILVAVPQGHRLAGRSSVSLIEIQEEEFVGVKRGYHTRDLVDAVCETVGFAPKYVYEGNEPARVNALVEAGIGIGFIPGTAVNPREHIHYLRVEGHELVMEIALWWKHGRYISRAAQQFREVVEQYFNSLSSEGH
ncbi:LysR family transcriptional regulator [Paenibacillus barcinonensis]|uniref:DNA-binding transcriptional LysR family regulator n=1 Tax=Paenibacillus barcinonensis TaxID=198119 RepID=A0A2V4V5Y4_PAEBA|nr:LysR family transcriptional regulator [Paenibacillus barcinonensis]PYE47859.1 DNA-binding transcriptional LysR family regulator [Paenibacillus barcinonensis]QKS59051.1 LysR family transcriptional regulator [Paenibacillus barcinonensis]